MRTKQQLDKVKNMKGSAREFKIPKRGRKVDFDDDKVIMGDWTKVFAGYGRKITLMGSGRLEYQERTCCLVMH